MVTSSKCTFFLPWIILLKLSGALCLETVSHQESTEHRSRILLVSDSRYYIYGDYGRVVLEYINAAQSLHSGSYGGKFMLDLVHVQAPRNDSEGTFEKVCRGYSEGFPDSYADFVLDVSVTPIVSAVVKSFVKYAHVPSSSLMCCTKQERIQDLNFGEYRPEHLVFNPPSKVWFSVIREYVVNENMTTAAVIMDDTFELEGWHRMQLSNLPCKHIMLRLNFDDEQAVRNFTAKMITQGIKNFFVVASLSNAGKFLEEAYNQDLVDSGRNLNWFVLSKEDGHVQCTQCSSGKVVKLRPLIYDTRLRDEFMSYVKTKSSTGASLLHNENYNEIDLLYIFDSVRASISAFLAADQQTQTRRPAKPVTCDVQYSDAVAKTPGLPMDYDSPPKNLLGYLQSRAFKGVLGSVIAGNDKNHSIINAKLAVEDQTIRFEHTNITVQHGTWSHSEGLRDPHGRYPRAITSKIHRVTILVEEPFIFRYEKDRNDSSSEIEYGYKGYLIDLLKKIAVDLQFEYELYEVPDQQFGAVDENGEWNGLIRELVDKKADIALAPLSVMAERENVVDFTVPYFDLVGITILMKKSTQEQSLFKFVTVLEAPVWGSIFGAYVLTSLLMFVFDRYSPYSYRNILKKEAAKKEDEERRRQDGTLAPVDAKVIEAIRMEKTEEVVMDNHDEYGTRIFTLKESLWFCMTSLTPQGGGEAPRNLSGRLVAATWWMFGFIIIASYTANLAAFLTVSRLETQIDSLDALAKQYGIRYAALENSATETYFKRMWKIEEKFYEIWRDMSLNESMSDKERAELAVWDYPVSDKYTKLWLTMKDFEKPKTYEQGIEWVKATKVLPSGEKEGFALIGDTAILQYKANLDCNLTIVGEEFSRKPYALAVQEGSVLRDQLSGVILKLLNQRELELMKEEWWQTRNQRKCSNNEDENEGISIENIGGVFILVLAGTVLACIMLAFEYYWYKRRGVKAPVEIPEKNIVIEAAKGRGRHHEQYNFERANFNTDFNTRFHNVFPENEAGHGQVNLDKETAAKSGEQDNDHLKSA